MDAFEKLYEAREALNLLGVEREMGTWLEQATTLREAMDAAGAMLDDKQASTVPALYMKLTENGTLVRASTRINWSGAVKRAKVDLWDTKENNPDNAPDLWEGIEYKNGIRIIPAQISAEHPFRMDELGWWGDELFKSKLAANVWTPERNPSGWEKQEQGSATRAPF